VGSPSALDARWQLYRLLSEPVRLRLLALASEEELSVGELGELLEESQPNISRHAAALRQAGLLSDRKEGTRTFVRLAESAQRDPVVADALGAGQRLCREEGSLSRVAEVVRTRDARTREFFAKPGKPEGAPSVAEELPAYLFALAPLIEHRSLAVDAGTGDGAWLDVLAPVYDRVIALDRSEHQLGRALARIRARGYGNVELIRDEVDGREVRQAAKPGADLVVCSRMLHHAPRPKQTLRALVQLARPGGRVLVVDYLRHEDERLSEQQADVWLGFEPREMSAFAAAAGLSDPVVVRIPKPYVGQGMDAHVGWQVLVGRRPLEASKDSKRHPVVPTEAKPSREPRR
jgi:ArsR family transcriptional regulator